jgi:hypothetical protein
MKAAIRQELEEAKAGQRSHRRLRFNTAVVAEHLELGPVPAQVVDVTGICEFLKIERDALEQLIKEGLPHADINPRAIRARKTGTPQ